MNSNTLKILWADDEEDIPLLIKQMFRREIKEGQLHFLFAPDGRAALDLLMQNSDINLVLADINMPIMNGLDLLSHIAQMNNPLLKVVMVSAYGDMHNIRAAMNNGAFDFITKPIDYEDLRATIEKVRHEVLFIRKKIAQSTRLKSLESDLAVGAEIQKALLPVIEGSPAGFPSLKVLTYFKPAKEVGGDFYDVFSNDKRSINFLIADVSGKGIPAAAFMLIASTAVKLYSQDGAGPGEILERTNNFLCRDNRASMFATAFLASFDKESRKLRYAFAGHNKPLLVRRGQWTMLEGQANTALGIVEGKTFVEQEMPLNPGDKIVLYTDGLNESINEQEEPYDREALQVFLNRHAHLPVIELTKALIADLENFTGELEPFDDITLVAFELNGPNAV